MSGLSPAGSSLMGIVPGLGGALTQQVKDETDEERRRRLQEQQTQRAGFSPAGRSALAGGVLNLSF